MMSLRRPNDFVTSLWRINSVAIHVLGHISQIWLYILSILAIGTDESTNLFFAKGSSATDRISPTFVESMTISAMICNYVTIVS